MKFLMWTVQKTRFEHLNTSTVQGASKTTQKGWLNIDRQWKPVNGHRR